MKTWARVKAACGIEDAENLEEEEEALGGLYPKRMFEF